MPCKILIITRGYARYRENLVSGVAASLPTKYILQHSTPHFSDELWEVDWNNLLEDGGLVTHIRFPRIDLRTYSIALLARFTRTVNPTRDLRQPMGLEELSPDIVLIQEFSPPMLKTAFYCFLRGIPCIVCSDLGKNSDWSQFSWHTRVIHRAFAFLTSGIVAHTEAARIPLARKKRPICFIPHSVDIRNFSYTTEPPPEGPVRILMVAQYIPRKGHDLLAKAIRLIVDRGIGNFEIRLVGTQDPAWLNSIIESEKIEDSVKILGVLTGDDLFQEFRLADVFVLTSRFDTFAVVVHEAAAFGLPLLISKFAESSALMVSEGINGYIIDPYNTSQLADYLEQLISQPETRQQMGAQSRLIAESLCASKLGNNLASWLVDFHQNFSKTNAKP